MPVIYSEITDVEKTKLDSIPVGGVQGPQIWLPTTPAALVGNVNDYNPSPGLSTFSVLRIDGGAADRTITGLVPANNSQIAIIENIGTTNNLTLAHQSVSSAAANRFIGVVNFDVVIPVASTAILWYDSTTTRWRVLSTAGGLAAMLTSSAPADVNTAAAIVGVDTTAARADHKHKLTNAVASSSAAGTTTTTSATDVSITGATVAIVPFYTAGLAFFQASYSSDNGAAITTFSIYVGGTRIDATEVSIADLSAGDRIVVTLAALVPGGSTVTTDVRWKTTAGTATLQTRRLDVMPVY
jgi:hypothetical protein